MRRVSVLLLVVLPAAGCARCSATGPAPDGGTRAPAPVLLDRPLPPPRPWGFFPARPAPDLALPDHCRTRAPTVRASVDPTTRFVAEPRTLGALVVADSAGDPPALTGVAALRLDPAGASADPRPVPWFEPAALPRLARSDARWIAALDRGRTREESRVLLWRDGQAEVLGEGDSFESVELGCTPARCALLTTRLGPVARPGATLWIGAPTAPAAAWQALEIAPEAGESDARPIGLAALDPAPAGGVDVTAAILEHGQLAFHRAGGGTVHEIARVPAPNGVLDAIALPAPVAIGSSTAVDEEGCSREGSAGLRIERPDRPPVDLRTPAPPTSGYLRRLRKGALATWMSPLGCHAARKVVYAVVLDAEGSPAASALPVGDATSFAVASSGDDVDLFLQDQASVLWMRLTCAPP